MSTWIEINGARVEKEFFEANVREARNYTWTPIRGTDLRVHVHCLICGITIDPRSSIGQLRAYKAKQVYICAYCYDHFLTRGQSFKYDFGNCVRVSTMAPTNLHPGQDGCVCGMRDHQGQRLYLVEFGDGEALEIPENLLLSDGS